MTCQQAVLTIRALFELARYEVMNARFGFSYVRKRMARSCLESDREHAASAALIFDAVNLAACFYFKPVKCLQRSVVTVRLLREYGVACQLVIAYRPCPFFMHAWVEINGKIANDLPGYAEQLRVLYKL